MLNLLKHFVDKPGSGETDFLTLEEGEILLVFDMRFDVWVAQTSKGIIGRK
jgi:hypothetical protein